MESIILASSSPRRKEILKMMNIPFKVINPAVDESQFTGNDPQELSAVLAKAKLDSVLQTFKNGQDIPWILSADTVVAIDSRILGKPKDKNQAFEYINLLQGKTHCVVTSMAIYCPLTKTSTVKSAVTKVTFAPMSQNEISAYLDTGEWQSAAGAYKIQGLASCFISRIEGTSSCVVGLPIFDLYDILKSQGYSFTE